jgi:molybdate/tungstate transport system ATP-binding protein
MISVRSLSARRGNFAIRDVSFDVPRSAYGMIIGPAGAGKTTTLEAMAGLIPARSGHVILGGQDVTTALPEERRVAIVYQHAYLFPHLTVRDNVHYGSRDVTAADDLADRFGVAQLGSRDVRTLSGGERQLVAIVRALASAPEFLLLDEPFAALDPRTRAGVRRALKVVHAERGFTVLHVTHDFSEAGSVGDVAILMDAGRVVQSGPPADVFNKPATPYAASFLGAENILAGTARPIRDSSPDWSAGDPAMFEEHAVAFTVGGLTMYAIGDSLPGPANAVIRAEEIAISLEPGASSIRNQFAGRISEIAPSGAISRVTVDVGGVHLVAALTTRSVDELKLSMGREVVVAFKATAIHLC